MIGMSISLYQIIQLFMFQEVDKITQDISVKTFSAPVSPSKTDEIPQRPVSTMNEAGGGLPECFCNQISDKVSCDYDD